MNVISIIFFNVILFTAQGIHASEERIQAEFKTNLTKLTQRHLVFQLFGYGIDDIEVNKELHTKVLLEIYSKVGLDRTNDILAYFENSWKLDQAAALAGQRRVILQMCGVEYDKAKRLVAAVAFYETSEAVIKTRAKKEITDYVLSINEIYWKNKHAFEFKQHRLKYSNKS